MVLRKRAIQEIEISEFSSESDLLSQIRNMWEFVNLSQWIHLFGRAVRISEELDIEHIESECLKSDSTVLSDIGLALLKFVSSHRGLTPEIFDEYTRRQYVAKAPHRNPFGTEEEPIRFKEFDIFTKIRVLQQLTQWTMKNPERIREKMTEQKEIEQTKWRTENFGLDSQNRAYIVLANKRLYRLTYPQHDVAKPKKKAGKPKSTSSRRVSKRLKANLLDEDEAESTTRKELENSESKVDEKDDNTEIKCECMAVTLDDYVSFLSSIESSRNSCEKLLRYRIKNEIMPDLERQLEIRQRKQAQKERELLNLQKLAFAKRSSRIAGKMEQRKKQEEVLNIEKKRAAELAMARKEQEKWVSLENNRDCRVMTREQRLRERETRRILKEEGELAKLHVDEGSLENDNLQPSEQLKKTDTERNKQDLGKLEDNWIFDCICGAYGQIDDGTHSIACDNCGTWQHSKCVEVSKSEADRDDFSFVCATCVRRADDKERAKTKPPIKIKLSRRALSSTSNTPEVCYPLVEALSSDIDQKNALPSQNLTASCSSSDQNIDQTSEKSIELSDSQRTIQYNEYVSTNPLQNKELIAKSPKKTTESFDESYENPTMIAAPETNNPVRSCNCIPKRLSPKIDVSSDIPLVLPSANESITSERQVSQSQALWEDTQSESLHQAQDLPPRALSDEHQVTLSNASKKPRSSSHNRERRSSLTFFSLLTSAPTLSPIQATYLDRGLKAVNSSPTVISSPGKSCKNLYSLEQTSCRNCVSTSESDIAAALPHAATGVSPTKFSQPIAVSPNEIFGMKLSPMLPPVASLTPSPQVINHSPPIKTSEPELSKRVRQNVSP
ncbi:putative phd finger domain protein [Golovinomyces cichoracearum]|uniref:Putative phd finger domain protein n=1 Tax=Golovinomyces cichoracearum TaxID=62708 RepID=A0A420IVQ5_9PEZI|nr:putative phd finger domain protein [Golovinomyces cichoracearum]